MRALPRELNCRSFMGSTSRGGSAADSMFRHPSPKTHVSVPVCFLHEPVSPKQV